MKRRENRAHFSSEDVVNSPRRLRFLAFVRIPPIGHNYHTAFWRCAVEVADLIDASPPGILKSVCKQYPHRRKVFYQFNPIIKRAGLSETAGFSNRLSPIEKRIHKHQ